MSSKGAKYIVLPVYVIGIALLFAFLLTSGLILACATVYRHEASITELKQVIEEILAECRVNKELHVHANHMEEDSQSKVDEHISELHRQEELNVEDEPVQRSKRHLAEITNDSKPSVTGKKNRNHRRKGCKCRRGKRGEKGERGKNGDKGDIGTAGIKGLRGDDGTRGPAGVNGQPGHPGVAGPRGDRGDRGDRGSQGQRGDTGVPGAKGSKGDTGVPGTKGSKGDTGVLGTKGSKGNTGVPGTKGSKGNKGEVAKPIMYSQSAHIVAKGKINITSRLVNGIHRFVYWKEKHTFGDMSYNNGYIEVGVTGYYFIYSQLYHNERLSFYVSYGLRIDDREVLKTIHSVISSTRGYNTQYVSGIFKIRAGQRISVATETKRHFLFDETLSFFGAFLLHY